MCLPHFWVEFAAQLNGASPFLQGLFDPPVASLLAIAFRSGELRGEFGLKTIADDVVWLCHGSWKRDAH